MEKEFLKKAKAVGLPQNLIKIGLDNLKRRADAGLTDREEEQVDEQIERLLEDWEYMPVY